LGINSSRAARLAVMQALQAAVSEEEWQGLIEDMSERVRDPYSVAEELVEGIGLGAKEKEGH
jgi:hypothetical protein